MCSGGGARRAYGIFSWLCVWVRAWFCLALFGCVVFVVERGRCVERGRLSVGCEAERVNVERVSFDCC